jgi:hypothetical protein
MPNTGKEQYIKGHDRVCAKLHFTIRMEIAAKFGKEHWYEHIIKSAETSHENKETIL